MTTTTTIYKCDLLACADDLGITVKRSANKSALCHAIARGLEAIDVASLSMVVLRRVQRAIGAPSGRSKVQVRAGICYRLGFLMGVFMRPKRREAKARHDGPVVVDDGSTDNLIGAMLLGLPLVKRSGDCGSVDDFDWCMATAAKRRDDNGDWTRYDDEPAPAPVSVAWCGVDLDDAMGV